jgi:hypothetical protein
MTTSHLELKFASLYKDRLTEGDGDDGESDWASDAPFGAQFG